MCLDLYGGWFTQEEFEKCVDHVRISWIDSRNNPNFSRFDAVNNKYETYIETLNIRHVQPPLIASRLFEKWIYSKSDSEV